MLGAGLEELVHGVGGACFTSFQSGGLGPMGEGRCSVCGPERGGGVGSWRVRAGGGVGVGESFWPAGSQKSSSCVLAAVGLWGSHFSSPSLLFLSLQMEVLISTVGKL